jgi:hypothetical protein
MSTYTYTKHLEVKFDGLIDEIALAKEAYRRKDPVVPSIDRSQDLYDQLCSNLGLIQSQKYNAILYQYALIGDYLIKNNMSHVQGMFPEESDTLKSVAQVFEGEFGAIYHLRGIKPSDFKRLRKGKRKQLIDHQKRKLTLVCGTEDQTERKGKRRRVEESEETGEYLKAWYNGEIEFGKEGLWQYHNSSSGTNFDAARADVASDAQQ